jgi:hypothetical protein
LLNRKCLVILDSICWSSLQRPVSPGQYFTPFGRDTCEKCKCLAGKAVGCFFEKCPQLPDCGKYKLVEGTCCNFECSQGKDVWATCLNNFVFFNNVLCHHYLDNGFSDKTELSVLLSLGAGLALLLIILLSVLYCRRQGIKKSQEEQNEARKTQTEQSQSTTTTSGMFL